MATKRTLDSSLLATQNPQNILINGGFEIWQRGTTFSNPANLAYTADRWKVAKDGSTTDISQEATIIDSNSVYAMKINMTATGGSYFTVWQYVENWQVLQGKTITFSMRIRVSVANKVRLLIADGNGNAVSSYITTTGVYQTVTVSKAITAGNAWLAVGISVATDVTQTIYLDNAMLVVGTQPMDYIVPDPQQELAKCQRYYEKSCNLETLPTTPANYNGMEVVYCATTTNFIGGSVKFRVTKRVVPSTVTVYDNAGTPGKITNNNGNGKASTVYDKGQSGFQTRDESGESKTYITFNWTADAEI